MKGAIGVCLMCAVAQMLGCGPDDGQSIDPTDVIAGEVDGMDVTEVVGAHPEDASWYTMRIETPLGDLFEIDQSLDKNTYFSYGSTHIAPAVSLAMTDQRYFPGTMTLTLNFGIIVGSAQYPVQCDAAANYPFQTAGPPEVQANVQGIQYKSTVAGSEGSIEVEQWGTATGDVFSGVYEGTLLQEADVPNKLWLKIEGEFHFVLPEPAQGG